MRRPPQAEDTQRPPSIIKWTGSKRALATSILPHLPSYRRYFEPFLGGGAMLFYLAHPGACAGDSYAPLVDLWRLVRDDPTTLVDAYRDQWTRLQADRAHYFYAVRDRFNAAPNPLDLNFLLRTCVNGIVRFNQQGAFNNSLHVTRAGMHPDRFQRALRVWHPRLRDVEFATRDVAETVAAAQEGDFVYLDPPYAANKARYASSFSVQRLEALLADLNGRGVRWALSYDGLRGDRDYRTPIAPSLYTAVHWLDAGASAARRVLRGPIERVTEALYVNYPATC